MTTTYDSKIDKIVEMANDMEAVENLIGRKGRFVGSMVHISIADLAEISRTTLPAPEITFNQWQDIDREDSSTFPEHGTLFLLAHFDDYRNKWIVETDYFSTGTHSRSYHSYATHWMPLPNPPQTEKEIM